MEQAVTSGYIIKSILLIEDHFKREPNVTFDRGLVKHDVEIELNVNINPSEIIVTETVMFKQTREQKVEFEAKASFLGVFEKVGEPDLSPEEFGHVNAAAMILPYAREHISSLSSKAGIGLITIPPVVFKKPVQKGV